MMKTRTFVAGASNVIVRVSPHKSRNSLVVSPTGGSTYTVEYTVASHDAINPTWVPLANMTAATTLQTNELGSITGYRFSVTGGTNIVVDMSASK